MFAFFVRSLEIYAFATPNERETSFRTLEYFQNPSHLTKDKPQKPFIIRLFSTKIYDKKY